MRFIQFISNFVVYEKTNFMKKSVVNLLSGAIILTAMSVSCGKDLAKLTLDFETPAIGGGNLEISQGETLEIPFTVGQLEGYSVTAEATCDNNDYVVAAELDKGGKSGKITLTAPEFILEDTALKITITVKDSENSRITAQEITVDANSVLETLTAANCHLTSPDAFIKFPAVKGNSTDKLTFAEAELLWEDALNLIDTTFTLGGDAVYVKVAEGMKGNAVVCAKDSEGTIVWSWHIWVSEEDAKANSMTYTYVKDEVSTTFQFMDRNLGALTSELGTADVNGCFYQWGRKDPFPASDNEGGLKKLYDKNGEQMSIATESTPDTDNLLNTVKNPATRYTTAYSNGQSWITSNTSDYTAANAEDFWGFKTNTKSIYDPCPAGYRVPVTDAWRFLADKTFTKTEVKDENGAVLGYKVTSEDKDYYLPAQGEIDATVDEIDSRLGKSYYPGLNGYAYGRCWHSQFLPGDFKAYASEVTPGWYTAGYSYTTAYAFPVRCIKE